MHKSTVYYSLVAALFSQSDKMNQKFKSSKNQNPKPTNKKKGREAGKNKNVKSFQTKTLCLKKSTKNQNTESIFIGEEEREEMQSEYDYS